MSQDEPVKTSVNPEGPVDLAASPVIAYAPYPYVPPPKKVYAVNMVDAVFSLVAVVLGFLAWNWIWPKLVTVDVPDGAEMWTFFPGVAIPTFFALALVSSFVYFKLRGVVVTKVAIVGAVMILAAALPFAIYDTTPVHFIVGLALLVGFAVWHGYAAGTAISKPLAGLVLADAVNQIFVVPFSNLGAWFASLRHLFRGGKRASQWLFGVISVIVAIPVFALVLTLLIGSDSNFSKWMNSLGGAFTHISVWGFIWQFSLGLLVAIYLFASMHGNARRGNTAAITSRGLIGWAQGARRLAAVALVAPMIILCLTYAVFLTAVGASLGAAFRSPDSAAFAYADYARSGFFQLMVVAAINLLVLGISWLFVRRGQGYPRAARIVGGIMSALTLLMIAAAMSKLVLYIQQFGLTRLRLYTLWFMAVMFIVFAIVGVWHIRPFRAGRSVVVVAVAALLVLLWANTDAIIANYNVDRYLDGSAKTVDATYLGSQLSTAAVPALIQLGDKASDPAVQAEVVDALGNQADRVYFDAGPWTSWNWQYSHAKGLLRDN